MTHAFLRFSLLALVLLLLPDRSQAQTWTAVGGGDWNNSTNWTGNFPNGANDTAIFSSTSASRTVNLNVAIQLRDLQFNSTQTGAVTIAPGTGGSLTLNAPGVNHTSILVNAGSGNHTLSANVTLAGSKPHFWDIGANRTFTVSGSIGGSLGLSKVSAGTLLLNGANTFTGPMSVFAGTLGGSGSIASQVTVAAGASIGAGISPAASTLTLGNGLTLNGKYGVTLFSNSTLSQIVAPAGAVSLTGGSLEIGLGSGVTVAAFRAAGARSFTIIDAANNQLSGTFATTNFTTAGFAASEWSLTYDAPGGNAILNFTPVPEPTTVIGICAIGLGMGLAVRRRFSSRSVGLAA